MLGFIILRHVNSPSTNLYWIECVRCIRKWYNSAPIMIIDDNSDYNYISSDITFSDVTIVQSEFPKRGEILPYYYFHKLKPFDKAVIVNDSVFIQNYIYFENVKDVEFLWRFDSHAWDNIESETEKLKKLKNNEDVLKIYESKEWAGCFGGMSIITHEFLSILVEKYDMFRLLSVMSNREDRMCFERIFAVLCWSQKSCSAYFGCIHDFCRWGITLNEYFIDPLTRPIVKVWTGR